MASDGADAEMKRAILLSLGVEEDSIEECDGRSVSLVSRHVSPALLAESPFAHGGALFSNRLIGLANPDHGNTNTVSFYDVVHVSGRLCPERALITSFGEDIGFLSSMFGHNCQLTLIRHYDAAHDPPGVHRIAPRLTVVHPTSLDGSRGCFHAKLMILVFTDRVRVAVSSANLTNPDWTMISQLIWVADFPRRSSFGVAAAPQSQFVNDLRMFLGGIIDTVDEWLNSIDDQTDSGHHTAARLVFSKPGSAMLGNTTALGGIPLLHSVLQTVWPTGRQCTSLVVATSSLGSLGRGWLGKFPHCHNVAVMFPTKGDICRANAAGFSGENFICLRKECLSSKYFAADALRRIAWKNPAREPALSHIKALIWTSGNNEVLAACVGSHNLTASAWGYIDRDRLIINNFELSVLLPPSCFAALPFVLPPPAYTASDVPWSH